MRVLAALALAALGGCDPWRCDFHSHGACVEFVEQPADLAVARRRVDTLLDLELPYWNLHSLAGWRVQFRRSVQYPCYLSDRNEGCTDFPGKTISVRIPPDSQGCFEAAELLHELGHYTLGDPIHSAPAWRGVPDRFAPIVWDRPGAPASCLSRYQGIRTGMWNVNFDRF